MGGTVHDREMCVGPTLGADSTGGEGGVFAGSRVAITVLLYPDQFIDWSRARMRKVYVCPGLRPVHVYVVAVIDAEASSPVFDEST